MTDSTGLESYASDDLVDHYHAVHKFAIRFERPFLSAEDITQEAYRITLERIRNKGPPENPRSFMCTIAKRVALQAFRRQGLKRSGVAGRVDSGQLVDPRTSEPSEAYVVRESRQQLREALGELTYHDRNLLELHYFQGRSCEQIGEALEIKREAVRTRLFRARNRLRASLDDPDGYQLQHADNGGAYWVSPE